MGAIGGLLAAIFAYVVRGGNVFPGDEWRELRPIWQFYAAVITDGIGVGCIFVAVSIAPEYITGAESGLVMLIELVLGPFWVYLAYGDRPPFWTLLGCTLLLLTLIVHELVDIYQTKSASNGYSVLNDLERNQDEKTNSKDIGMEPHEKL